MTRLPFVAKQDPVEYLVRKRHPDGCFRDSAVDSTPLRPAIRASIEAANAYRTELHALPKDELQTLFEEARADDAEQARLAVEETEQTYRFNRPEAQADFKYWASMSYWTIDESVALSFSRNPKVASWEAIKPYAQISTFVWRFVAKREIALRAKTMKQLSDFNVPSYFIAWANRTGFDMPEGLVGEVTGRGFQIADWKTQYDQQKVLADTAKAEAEKERNAHLADIRQHGTEINELIEQQRALMKAYDENAKAKDAQTASLLEEIERLSQEAATRENGSNITSIEKPVGTRERDSMVKLIIGMAMAGYSYDPQAARSAVPAEIEGDLERLGIGLNGDTIRKYVREGAEHLPSSQDD